MIERLDYSNPLKHKAFWIEVDNHPISAVCEYHGFRKMGGAINTGRGVRDKW